MTPASASADPRSRESLLLELAQIEQEHAALLRAEIGLEQEEARRCRADEHTRDADIALANGPGAFAAFVRWAWHIVEPGADLIWNWHLDLLCGELQAVLDGEVSELVICIPPGTAKSLLTAVMLPAFDWLHRPWRRAMYLSASVSVCSRDSSRCRDVITNIDYTALAARAARSRGEKPWGLKKGNAEKKDFWTDAQGYRVTFPIGGKLIGQRAHFQVIDDPVDVNEVISGSPERIRERMAEAWEYISKKLSTRLNFGKNHTARILIMQRLHPLDPARCAIAKGWRTVALPMRFNPDYPAELGGVHPLDPRTMSGELMCPELIPEQKVLELESDLGDQADGQLGQIPKARGGGRIKREWFQRYTEDPLSIARRAAEVWISSDAAKKGNADSDLHSIHVWARVVDAQQVARYFLLDRWAGRVGMRDYERQMLAMYARWKEYITRGGGVLVEDTANGATFLEFQKGKLFGLTDFRPQRDTPGNDKSKEARAVYLERPAQQELVFVPEVTVTRFNAAAWVEQVLDYWCAFPGGTNDDDVDSASQILMRWARQPAINPDFAAWALS